MAKKKSILARAKNFERWLSFAIGGNRVYGQSAKGMLLQLDGDATGGDVKNDYVVGECKSYDPAAGTKWRKDNPLKPAKSFSIKVEWIDKIEQEAHEVGKHPFLAFNNKHSPLTGTYIIISLDLFLQLLYAVGWGTFENVYAAWAAWKTRFLDRIEEDDNGE
jgi:hypothetical protein